VRCFLLCAATAMALPAQTFTTLFSFGRTNGADPEAGLVQVANGDLYGTANGGGEGVSGTVLKITLSGTLTTLYSFCSLATARTARSHTRGCSRAMASFMGPPIMAEPTALPAPAARSLRSRPAVH
jgi:uncharacterized repeat protein (TIGR03803 family)